MAIKGLSLSSVLKDFSEGLEKQANFDQGIPPEMVPSPEEQQAAMQQEQMAAQQQEAAMQEQAMQEQAMAQQEAEQDQLIDKAVDAVAETSADKAKAVEELKQIAKTAAEKEQEAIAKEAAMFGKSFAEQFMSVLKTAGIDEELKNAKEDSPPAEVDKEIYGNKEPSPRAAIDAEIEAGKDHSKPVPPETHSKTEHPMENEKLASETIEKIYDEAYEVTLSKLASDKAYEVATQSLVSDEAHSTVLVKSAFEEAYNITASDLIAKEAFETAQDSIRSGMEANESGEILNKVAEEAYSLASQFIQKD